MLMNRSWLRSSFVMLWAISSFAVANIVQADDMSAEKIFPKDTLVFFTIANVPEMGKDWEKTSIGQLVQDPAMKPFMDDVYAKKDEISKDYVEDTLGVSIDDLLKLPQGELTIALLEKPAQKLALVVVLEYGSNQEMLDKLLKKMDEELEKQNCELSTEEIEGVKVQIYNDKDQNPNEINTIAYFTDKKKFVISNEVDAIKEVLSRWDGKSDDTLAQNEQHQYIQNQCKPDNGEPVVKLFINPMGLIQAGISLAQSAFPQAGMAAGFLPLLGLDGLKGYGGAAGLDDGDFEGIGKFFLYCDNPRGLVGVFNFPATELSPPSWVPATVGSYTAMNWNLAGAYTSIETLIDSFQGRGATARLVEQLADREPNIHIKKDLIDVADGKIHVIQNEPQNAGEDDEGQPIPSFFVAVGLKDAAKMKKTVTAIAKAGGDLETREFNGETIYEIEPPGGDQVFSFAIAEGNLVFTNETPMLESMIRGRAAQTAPLSDSDDYKQFAKHIPSKTSILAFQRGDVQMKMAYNIAKKMEPDTIEGIDFSKLPPFEAISKYLRPSASYTVPDKKGAKTVSFTLKK